MKNKRVQDQRVVLPKKDKTKRNGLVLIHAHITINGKQAQFNTASGSHRKNGKV